MTFSMFRKVLLVVVNIGCFAPLAGHAGPRSVTLPMLEVPDELMRSKQFNRQLGNSVLLNSPIELTNEADRRVAAREQAAWRRMSGSLCSGCGEPQRIRNIGYVDPIAVLNAKPSAWRSTVIASRPTVVAQAAEAPRIHRVRFAHRHRHRSRLYAYLSRVRYSMLRWRQRHHHHTRLVQR